MFTGLYFVLWGKGKEEISTGDNDNKYLESESDVEKPLLSWYIFLFLLVD